MSWAIAQEQIKTTTPKRLEFKREEPQQRNTAIPDLHGTREVDGQYLEQTLESENLLWVSERADTKQKYVRKTVYDPTQTSQILERCFSSFDTYRRIVPWPAPESIATRDQLWPTLGITFGGADINDYKNNRPVIKPQPLFYDWREAEDIIGEMQRFYLGYILYVTNFFVAYNVGKGPYTQHQRWNFATGGQASPISFEEAQTYFENFRNYWLTSRAGLALSQGPLIIGSWFAKKLFSLRSKIANVKEKLLEMIAAFEIAYFELTRLPGTSILQRHIAVFLSDTWDRLRLGLEAEAEMVDLTSRMITVPLGTAADNYGPAQTYFEDWLFGRNNLKGPTVLLDMQLRHWEALDTRDLLAEYGVPVSGKTLREKHYSGTVGFCGGTVDAVHMLTFNDTTVPNIMNKGVNDLYYPLILGGFDNGNGGLGTTERKKVSLWDGSDSQIPLNADNKKARNDYNYRGVSLLTFDNFNLGGGQQAPRIKALITRLETEWEPRWSVISTSRPGGLHNNQHVVVLAASDADKVAITQYLQRIAFGSQTYNVNGTVFTPETPENPDTATTGTAVTPMNMNSLLNIVAPQGSMPAGAVVGDIVLPSLPANTRRFINASDFISNFLHTNTDERIRYSKENIASAYGFNPVHKLREILIRGFKVPEESIDNGSFLTAAKAVYFERLAYSFNNSSNQTRESIFKMIKDYLSCEVYYDPQSEKVKIKLIRDDFDVNEIPSFDEDNVSHFSGYQRNYNSKPVTRVTLSYKGYDNQDKFVSLAAPNFTDNRNTLRIAYPCCPDETTAIKLASRELVVANNSPLSFTIRIDAANSRELGIGDPVIVSWRAQKIDRMITRVSRVSLSQNDLVNVQLVQDMFVPLITNLVSAQPQQTTPAIKKGWGRGWGKSFGGL